MIKRTIAGSIVLIALAIVGCMLLIRSCLSKYDERAAISHPVVFQKNGKGVIFSLIKFDKAISYSQDGGFIQKSVATTYSVQTNDLFTAEKIKETKVKDHSEVKSYPVEIIGSSADKAWIFANELMAYDPFTLEKIADTKILENKNPSLTGKLTNERKYYQFDEEQDRIFITTKDGNKYKLDTKTLLITVDDEDEIVKDPIKAKATALANELKKIEKLSEENAEHFKDHSSGSALKELHVQRYRDSMNKFYKEREHINELRDSIYKLQSLVNEERSYFNSNKNRSSFLNNENNSFGSIKLNTDTFMNKWYGLHTAEILEKLPENFDYRSDYNDAARNKLYSASVTAKDPAKKYSYWIIGNEKQEMQTSVYLQGGFLMDKQKAIPIHLFDPAGFLIVHKATVGNDAFILISRIDTTGKNTWMINTGLKSFAYWFISGNYMIITGVDNKELNSGQNNVLHVIDITNGSFKTFDFFTDKIRVTK